MDPRARWSKSSSICTWSVLWYIKGDSVTRIRCALVIIMEYIGVCVWWVLVTMVPRSRWSRSWSIKSGPDVLSRDNVIYSFLCVSWGPDDYGPPRRRCSTVDDDLSVHDPCEVWNSPRYDMMAGLIRCEDRGHTVPSWWCWCWWCWCRILLSQTDVDMLRTLTLVSCTDWYSEEGREMINSEAGVLEDADLDVLFGFDLFGAVVGVGVAIGWSAFVLMLMLEVMVYFLTLFAAV